MYNCPSCQGESGVIDSRPIGKTTRRRRECKSCKHRWTTFEINADEMHALWKLTKIARALVKTTDGLKMDLESIGDLPSDS